MVGRDEDFIDERIVAAELEAEADADRGISDARALAFERHNAAHCGSRSRRSSVAPGSCEVELEVIVAVIAAHQGDDGVEIRERGASGRDAHHRVTSRT